jgi:hypothetical protein
MTRNEDLMMGSWELGKRTDLVYPEKIEVAEEKMIE